MLDVFQRGIKLGKNTNNEKNNFYERNIFKEKKFFYVFIYLLKWSIVKIRYVNTLINMEIKNRSISKIKNRSVLMCQLFKVECRGFIMLKKWGGKGCIMERIIKYVLIKNK